MDNPKPRGKPLYGTDITRPLPELIESIRAQIVQTRGQLDDISYHIGWKETLDNVTGLLTCGLVTLAWVKDEVVKSQTKQDE